MISDDILIEYIRPSTDDDLPTLRRLEQAAIAMIQKRTGRYFGVEGEISESLSWRGWPMQLGNTPAGGALTTFEQWDGSAWSAVAATSYYVDGVFVYWNSTASWSPLTMPSRYRVTYDAGFTAGTGDEWEAPEDIKQAVLLLVGHWFENREAVVVGTITAEVKLGVDALIDGHIRVAV